MLYQTEPESLIPDAAADAEEKNSVVYRSSCDTDSCFHFIDKLSGYNNEKNNRIGGIKVMRKNLRKLRISVYAVMIKRCRFRR